MSQTHERESSVRTYAIIFILLMALMLLTVIAAHVHMGEANILVALLIAVVKATLVVLFFMHVKYSGKLVWIFAGAAFLWLGIMLVLTLSDYASRAWVPRRLADQPVARLFGSSGGTENVQAPMVGLRGIEKVHASPLPTTMSIRSSQ